MTAPAPAPDPVIDQNGPWLTDFLSGVIEPTLTLAAAIGLVWSVFVTGHAVWRRTWGSRRDLRKRIDNLGIGLAEDYLEELFGKPLLREKSGASDVLTFLPPHAWVSCWARTVQSAPSRSRPSIRSSTTPPSNTPTGIWTSGWVSRHLRTPIDLTGCPENR